MLIACEAYLIVVHCNGKKRSEVPEDVLVLFLQPSELEFVWVSISVTVMRFGSLGSG